MDSREMLDALDMEFVFERESLPYKMSRGSSGMQINAKHCPFCGDARWRVYMNAETGLGNCFVCNETIRKFTFLEAHLGAKPRDVFSYVQEALREQGWKPKRTVTAAVDPGEIRLPYSHPLPLESGENLLYLEQRGFGPEITSYFHLRWCEFGWWIYEEDGAKKQQQFNNRIIIPVYDLDGTLVTFQGRDLTGVSDRKYLFPKLLPGTGRFLLNGQNVQLTKDVALGEGAFDVAAMKLAFDEEVGLRHVVPIGSFGKHLSYGAPDGNDQLGRFMKLKQGGVERVTIMWDGGEKELIAALNAGKLLNGLGLVARIALLPAGKDPNEVTPDVVRAAYWEAQVWTPKLDIRWRLRNPYSASKAKVNVD